ncbi:MAG: HAD-IA family hydrolase [Acidobacteriota bacterium]|nr:HAD-IA family hydrolase [Acidobacteriota bacterium]
MIESSLVSGPRVHSADPPPFRLLVFDWDGTLMDSVASILACTQAAIRDTGLGNMPDERIRHTIGLGMREAIETLYPGCGEVRFHQIIDRYRDHWYSTYRDRPVLFPGVSEMLARLLSRGYLLAVATGKSRRGLEQALAQSGVGGCFVVTRTADEARSKPHPQMLLDILDELGIAAGSALMVGDSTHDLRMARSAGTPSIAVCNGSETRAELVSLGPLACLEKVVELPDWLTRPR